MERVARGERQKGLAPGRAAVGRTVLPLLAAAADVVRGGDDLLRVPIIDPDIGLAAPARGGAGDPQVQTGGRFLGQELQAGAERELGVARLQVLVGHHPLVDFLEDVRVAARGVRRQIPALGMVAPPPDPQPGRHGDLVEAFLSAQQTEILVVLDERFQGAAWDDFVLRELIVQGRPISRGRGLSAGERQDQAQHYGVDDVPRTHTRASSSEMDRVGDIASYGGARNARKRAKRPRRTAASRAVTANELQVAARELQGSVRKGRRTMWRTAMSAPRRLKPSAQSSANAAGRWRKRRCTSSTRAVPAA